MDDDITADDFITGMLAEFARRGVPAVSMREDHFYPAMLEVFHLLQDLSPKYSLDPRFYVYLDPTYQDSPILREAITGAVQRDIISLDNPEYVDMRLKIDRDEAVELLKNLPGGQPLFQELADAFLMSYPYVAA